MLCYLYNTGLLLKLTHKTINSMKKLPVCLLLLPHFFYIGLGSGIRDPRSGIRDPGSEIRDEQILGSGSGIRDNTSRIRNTAPMQLIFVPGTAFKRVLGQDQNVTVYRY
jgi:hypothetical protein